MGNKNRKTPGYWQDLKNVEAKLKEVIADLGHFPTQRELRDLDLSGFISAVSRHHGGLRSMGKKLGYDLPKKPDGYWKDFENVKRELEPIIEELGYFPGRGELYERGYSSVVSAIFTHHGGPNYVRKRMGYEEKNKKPFGYWKDFENVKRELEPIIEELGHFPTQDELIEKNYTAINGAIRKYHGLRAIRKRMGYEIIKRPNGYWDEWENVKKELMELIEELGHFPTQKEISERKGHTTIMYGIQKQGGFTKVRKKMGYKPPIKKQSGYWKDFENVKRELEPIIEELGHFPTPSELMGGYGYLYQGMRHHGGILKVKEKMGYGVSKIQNKTQFTEFLKQEPTARNLVAVALASNGEAADIEQIIIELYEGRFNRENLHQLLNENREEITDLLGEGLTNLGSYVGKFRLGETRIMPMLMGEIISNIGENRITSSLEERLVRILRHTYGPHFNQAPEETIQDISSRVRKAKGKSRKLYEKLRKHYQTTLKLREELG